MVGGGSSVTRTGRETTTYPPPHTQRRAYTLVAFLALPIQVSWTMASATGTKGDFHRRPTYCKCFISSCLTPIKTRGPGQENNENHAIESLSINAQSVQDGKDVHVEQTDPRCALQARYGVRILGNVVHISRARATAATSEAATHMVLDDGTGVIRIVLSANEGDALPPSCNTPAPTCTGSSSSAKRRKMMAPSKRATGSGTYTPPRRGDVLPGLSDSRTCITLGSLIEVIGECCRVVPNSELDQITPTHDVPIDSPERVFIEARTYAIVRDPNFETLRVLEIKKALESNEHIRISPTSVCKSKESPPGKNGLINQLLEGLTDGDFESMSPSSSSQF